MKIDDVADKVAVSTGVAPASLKKAVRKMFREIQASVVAGEKVAVPGFGVFMLKTREAGDKVDPKTGQTKTVSATSSVSFRPSRPSAGKSKGKNEAE